MELSKLFHGFVKVFAWICQSCSLYFLPFTKQTKLRFVLISKLGSFCFELKVLNKSRYSMPWVCCGCALAMFKLFTVFCITLSPISSCLVIQRLNLFRLYFWLFVVFCQLRLNHVVRETKRANKKI